MRFTTIPSSQGRKQLPQIIKDVDETGKIVVFTIHGQAKAAMVDLDLLDEFMENTEYGISERELLKRVKEPTMTLDELRKTL